jgi:hypothetical protein
MKTMCYTDLLNFIKITFSGLFQCHKKRAGKPLPALINKLEKLPGFNGARDII